LIYLDISAIVPYYVPEKSSSVVEQLLQKQEHQPINSIYNCMISVLQLQ
jgi:predicted nucleic acid-binding protein